MENLQYYKSQKTAKGLHISMRFMNSHTNIIYKIKQFLSIYLDTRMTLQTHINKYNNSFDMDVEFSTFLSVEVCDIVITELKYLDEMLMIRKITHNIHNSFDDKSNIV